MPNTYYDWDPSSADWVAKTGGTSAGPSSSPPQTGGNNSADPLQNYADLSKVIGSYGQGQKADRMVQGQFTQNYDRLMLEREAERRANENDAMRKLATTGYIQQGGSHFAPGNITLNGKEYTLPTYGLEPPKVTPEQQQAASTLSQQMLQRVGPNGTYTPQPLDSYAKPGTLERITDIAAPAVAGLGVINNLTHGGVTGAIRSGLSHIPGLGGLAGHSGAAGITSAVDEAGNPVEVGAMGGSGMGSFILGKAIPAAGAAYGAYELGKNKSLSSDLMSGATSGAGIGTMVLPGVGTAVGAGIGALGGLARHAFGGPDQVEKAGRTASADTFGQLGLQATPAQRQEAAAAGWDKPEQALAMITMRDRFIQQGMTPEQAGQQASQYMNSIWGAERHGDKAVASAASPIAQMFRG